MSFFAIVAPLQSIIPFRFGDSTSFEEPVDVAGALVDPVEASPLVLASVVVDDDVVDVVRVEVLLGWVVVCVEVLLGRVVVTGIVRIVVVAPRPVVLTAPVVVTSVRCVVVVVVEAVKI